MLPLTAGVTMLLPPSPRRHHGQQDDSPVARRVGERHSRTVSIVDRRREAKILDEFIAVMGYHEKSAIRALNAEPKARGC
jgi:hypothetical protein